MLPIEWCSTSTREPLPPRRYCTLPPATSVVSTLCVSVVVMLLSPSLAARARPHTPGELARPLVQDRAES